LARLQPGDPEVVAIEAGAESVELDAEQNNATVCVFNLAVAAQLIAALSVSLRPRRL
jgi:hypothetical protein